MKHQANCHCDQCLLTQMKSIDKQERQRGWETWYQRDSPTLQVFIERRCQDLHCPDYSDDILQDCFLMGFKNISSGRYQEQGRTLCAYLYGIVKNLLREVIRLQRKEPNDRTEVDVAAEEKISLDDRIYLAEILRLVQEAHYRQPLLHRQVVNKLYGEGRSSKEVAVELHTTAGNTRAIAYRTVNVIRAYLEEQHHLNLSSSTIRACLPML